MKYKNDWLEKELNNLQNDKKFKKVNDTSLLIKFVVFLVPLLIWGMNLSAHEQIHICPECRNAWGYTQSAQWRCKGCGMYCYSESPDWKGDYYCSCGLRMGDEE